MNDEADRPIGDTTPKSIHRVHSDARRHLLRAVNADFANAAASLTETCRRFNYVSKLARRNGMQLHSDASLDLTIALCRTDFWAGQLQDQFGLWERSIGAEIAPEIEWEIDAIRRKIMRGAL